MMIRLHRCLHRRLRDEAGMSLPELLVSMMILGIVLPAIYGVLWSMQRGFGDETNRSINNTQINLAVQKLDKEIQSAQAITVFKVTGTNTCGATSSINGSYWCPVSPANGSAGNGLVVYTQAYANNRELQSPGPSAGFSCIAYRVVLDATSGLRMFQARRWPPDWRANPTALVGPWVTVASEQQMPSTADGTISAAATASATTITVNEPTAGGSLPFPISVGTGAAQEQMMVTGVTGSGPAYTYTVTRGVNGTTAVAHAASEPLTQGTFFILNGDTSYGGRLLQATLTMNQNRPPVWPLTSTSRSTTQNQVLTRAFAGWNVQFQAPNVCATDMPS